MLKTNITTKRRLRKILLIAFLIIIALIIRLGYIQLIDGKKLAKLAYEQQTLDRTINPKRGTIYDSTGQVLAQSSTVETVSINPGNIDKKDKEKVAKKLAEIFNLDYEKILKDMKGKPIIIDLLVPIKIELRKDEYLLAEERLKLLEEYGFSYESFGTNTIIIRSHPAWIPEEKAEEIIRRLVDLIIEKGNFDFDQFIWRMAATTACRMSVMANDYISSDDQEWILENIRYCENPFTCPHGRPTIITYTKYELEKLFKRQLDC